MDNDTQYQDPIDSPTRPSAPRAASASQTIAVVGQSTGTTLPIVRWSQSGGAMLEPSALPRYETLDLLGEGGMGEVVRARDNDIGREVAVKRLRVDLQHPEHFARFVEEVRTIGQLEHPNIVPIHDAGLDAQGYFFVMKHLQGETLAAIIARLDAGDPAAHARWPFERRVDVMRKVLEALRYAHAKGVVHRDLKPANVLVGPMGEVYLLDWGIAKRGGAGPAGQLATVAPAAHSGGFHTQDGAVMGTPLYMSPEQVRGEPVDARSDLYSLCMVLYEFARLRHPFAELTNTAQVMEAVLTRPIPHAASKKHSHQALVPMDLSWLIKKGLSKDPAKRYQSADELLRRLEDRAEGNVPIQCHITATKRASYEGMKLVSRHPYGFLVVLVACLGGGIFALLR